jgi:peptidyl-prolyl cis-trans isomerase D
VLQSMRSAAKYIFWFIAITFVGGFLLAETSGLLGRNVTASTPVVDVNGREVPYDLYARVVQNAEQEQSERLGRALTLDERKRVEDQAFNQLVSDILLEQEYKRRGITVTDDEIREAARVSPPPQLLQAPELQTDGRFDPVKYQRFLSSPAARQQGLLVQLENYYRTEIPRDKLFQQVASDVYLSDARLWSMYQDQHDSAQISFVAFRAEAIPDSSVKVTDAELRTYYDKHAAALDRPGRAVVSLVMIPRVISAADSSAVRQHALALRTEITSAADQAAKFAEVAKRESADSGSGSNGGELGKGTRGRFVPAFEDAAYKLKVGEISEPVLTQFGYHVIRLNSRSGDTLDLSHILLRIQQGDSAATLTDRRADSLSTLAGSADQSAKFDSAARVLNLPVVRATVFENEPLTANGRYVPSVSAWAFGGAHVGESSELFDDENGYYLARLDTLVKGGKPSFDAAKDEVRTAVTREKKLQQLLPKARQFASAAATSSLDQAAKAQNLAVQQSPLFTRLTPVPGIGQLNQAVGAAFTLPVGAVSSPIETDNGIYVIRVDRRTNASKTAFEAQKQTQRDQLVSQLREQRVRDFIDNLRKAAKIQDNRAEIQAAARRET